MVAQRHGYDAAGTAVWPRHVSAAEYLRLDSDAAERYEYWQGLIYPRFYPPGSLTAIAGGTEAHDRLIGRLYAALLAHLDGGPCIPYLGNLRLRVDAETYFYPDVYVTCDPNSGPGEVEQTSAVLVAEVLSPSTTAFDRGEKLDAYQRLPEPREYVLLDSMREQATLFRSIDATTWQRQVVLEAGDLALESVDLRLPLAALYHGIRLDDESGAAGSA